MKERTLVGAFNLDLLANGAPVAAEHTIFAYESSDQTRSWRIKEVQCWLNPNGNTGGDSRALLNYCLSTDFLTPPASASAGDVNTYSLQYNASDNRGIAWGMMDYQNRDGSAADFRVPSFEFQAIADGRRAINYLILNVIVNSESSAMPARSNFVNYRVLMEEITVTPSESILHQVRGLAQDVS